MDPASDTLPPPTATPPSPRRAPKTAPSPSKDWWFSNDGRRGFCLKDVSGFQYSGGNGIVESLYVYLGGGIYRLTGQEAITVFGELKRRYPKAAASDGVVSQKDRT